MEIFPHRKRGPLQWQIGINSNWESRGKASPFPQRLKNSGLFHSIKAPANGGYNLNFFTSDLQ